MRINYLVTTDASVLMIEGLFAKRGTCIVRHIVVFICVCDGVNETCPLNSCLAQEKQYRCIVKTAKCR